MDSAMCETVTPSCFFFLHDGPVEGRWSLQGDLDKPICILYSRSLKKQRKKSWTPTCFVFRSKTKVTNTLL